MAKIKMTHGSKTIHEAFDEFMLYNKAKNLSKDTLINYTNAFNRFMMFYKTDALNINENTINKYKVWLNEQEDKKDITKETFIRNLRVMIYYWQRLGYVESFKIKLNRSEETIKETYSDEEISLLLKKPDIKKCTFPQYRNWVIINFLLATGVRKSSLINIKIKDLDFEDGFVTIRKTKNKKQQRLPMTQILQRILTEYLVFRKGESDEFLFCTETNTQLKPFGVRTAIERYNKSRGVMKTSLHLFRHTFAKKWIMSGGDVFRLQKILNHSTLEISQKYANIFSVDLQKDFDKHNALEQATDNSKRIKM